MLKFSIAYLSIGKKWPQDVVCVINISKALERPFHASYFKRYVNVHRHICK